MRSTVTVDARDVDEAWEQLQEADVIGALAVGHGTATCEYGVPYTYEYKGADDYDWRPIGEFEFTLEDLDIGTDEVLDYVVDLLDEIEELKKEKSKCKRKLVDIKYDLRKLIEKINKKEK